MPIKSVIRKGDYRDSVVLMRVSKELESFPGVTKASVMMGTSSNKELLKQAGILTKEAEAAGPNDLVIVAEASDEKTLAAAIAHAEKLLMEEVQVAERELAYKTVEAAIGGFAEADLVLISTPGQFAAREAMKALRAGKHVMIFSSDVPVEEEVKLKRFASEKGLLVMGPDCGTAIVGGVGLGFSNIVGRGPVGIVGAAGTGIQEVSSLLDEVGITSAIGTGSHDPSDAVGAITMISGLKALEEDENTKVIVLISKPPSPTVARKVMETVGGLKKPVVVDFIGGDPKIVVEAGGIPAKTLEDAALKAISILKGKRPKERKFTLRKKTLQEIVKRETERLLPTQKYIRGLFSGGTLCAEAQLLLRELVGDIYSNVPL
ncbi:MAG: hypothetical protein QXG38_03045, partial [Candidatus Hadarchaeales archaeon]